MKLIEILEVCGEYTNIQVLNLENEIISEYNGCDSVSEYLNEREVTKIYVERNILKIQVNENTDNKYIIESLIGIQLSIEEFDIIEEKWNAFYNNPDEYKDNKGLIEAIRESLR